MARYCNNCEDEMEYISRNHESGYIYWCSNCGTIEKDLEEVQVPTAGKFYKLFKEFLKEIIE